MIGPTVTPTISGFYPVGNTPPVDVLGSIPPGQDAAVLLLGCGDARNLLFTLYCRSSSDQGRFKFTCCDISAEIIARNILLYTLILDDDDGTNSRQIWNIYYHPRVDEDSLRLLQKQARKLANLGVTMENWRQQSYGKSLRFCDQSTLDRVAKIWRWYALEITDGPAFAQQQERLSCQSRKALEMHRWVMGGSCNTSILRSAAPCSRLVMGDMWMLLHGYWETGSTHSDAKHLAISKCLNPTFSTMHETSLVYTSMEPLHSFHLATAYVPLKDGSPLNLKSKTSTGLKPPAQAAGRQFQAWAETFRRVKDRLTIRFTASDARAFCSLLQHHVVHQNSKGAFEYQDRSRYEQLVLDPVEYHSALSDKDMFDVIDTSNLVDHWGSLNILAACRPLLKPGITSTIYMELLQLCDENLEAYSRGLLCGDIVTVSLLFGLNPIQYWTNTTRFSPHPEAMARAVTAEGTAGQARFIIVLKNSDTAGVTFDPDHLAHFVYRMYLRMFEHERTPTESSKAPNRLARIQFPQYTRGGLAVILRLVKDAQVVDFTVFMERLRFWLHSDSTLDTQNAQSLDLYLHEFQLCTSTAHSDNMEDAKKLGLGPLHSWLDVSSTVFLTIAVPHWKWSPFLSFAKPNGWPLFQLSLRLPNTDRTSHFADVQIGFGAVRTTGTRYTTSYAAEIETYGRGREGHSHLIVSALVPLRMLLTNASLTVAVQYMAQTHGDTETRRARAMSAARFPAYANTAYEATLDHESVFVTQNPPNMKGRMTPPSSPGEVIWQRPAGSASVGKVAFHMIFDDGATRAEKLNLHIDLSSTNAVALLQSNSQVEFKRLSAFVLELNIGSGSLAYRQQIRLPVALTTSGSKTRIARRSAYVQFIATIAAPDFLSNYPDSLYPISLICGKPILENIGYVHLDHLPIVDISDVSELEWIKEHSLSMLSVREREMMVRYAGLNTWPGDSRFNFKSMLAQIFHQYAGLSDKQPQSAFSVVRRGEKIPVMTIMISSLRLDLASLSITLDAAMLPSTAHLGTQQTQKILAQMHNAGLAYEVDDTLLEFWRHAAVAFVERCRDWEHTATCEHASPNTSIVPIARVDGNTLCSCGLGKFPHGYAPDVPVWPLVAKHCVRMAISLPFPVPLVEKVIDEKNPCPGMPTNVVSLIEKEGCWGCGGRASEHQKLLKCGGCKVAKYCSKACQSRDWK